MTKSWVRSTGLLVPPMAWAASTQLGQMTPDVECRQSVPWTATICLILLAVSIAGITVSKVFSSRMARTERFVATAGLLIALTFVFALSLQGAASVLLDPCQR